MALSRSEWTPLTAHKFPNKIMLLRRQSILKLIFRVRWLIIWRRTEDDFSFSVCSIIEKRSKKLFTAAFLICFGMFMLSLTLMASTTWMSCYCLASHTSSYLSQDGVIFSETHNLQSYTKLKLSNLSKVGWTTLRIISRYISPRLKINSQPLCIQIQVVVVVVAAFFCTFSPLFYILN